MVVGDRTDKESHTINAMIGSTFVCGVCLKICFFCVPGEYEAEICFVWKNSCGSLFKCFFFFSMFVVLIDYTFMFMTCHKGGSLAHKRYNCLFKSAGRQRLNSGPLPLLFLPVTFSCLAIQVKYINTQIHKYTQIQIHQHKYTIDCTTDLSHQYHHNSRYSEKLFISYLKLCYSGQPNFLPTSSSTMYLVPTTTH